MKSWLPLTLVLVVLVAGLWMLWIGAGPEPGQVTPGGQADSVMLNDRPNNLQDRTDVRESARKFFARNPGFNSGRDGVSSQADPVADESAGFGPGDDPESNGNDRSAGSAASRSDINSESDRADRDEEEDRVIGGMVTDEDGEPLSGIEVLARPVPHGKTLPTNFTQLDDGVLSVFSDFEGGFLFDGLENGVYQVRIAPAAGIAQSTKTVRVGPLNVNLVVAFLWDIRVHGVVTTSDGESLQGVQINAGLQSGATHTGSRGEYELDVSVQGVNQKQYVRYRSNGYRDQSRVIDPKKLDFRTTEVRFDITMEPLTGRATVAGMLIDTEGRPVPGQVLTMSSSRLRTSYQAWSDRRGAFAFKEVEPGSDYRLQVRPGTGYQDKDINSLEVPARGLNMDVVLEPVENGTLSGWMTDQEGNHIPGFALNLHSRTVAGYKVRVVGDSQGVFIVEDFPVGGAVFSTNSYPVFSVQGIRVSHRAEEPVMVVLDTGRHVLLGRVVDGLGEPVAGASVIMTWTFNDNEVRSSSSRKTASGQDGRFVFTGLGPGVHRIQVSASGFRTKVMMPNVGTVANDIVVELEENP